MRTLNENMIRANWLKSFKIFTSFFSFYFIVYSAETYLEGLEIDPTFSLTAIVTFGCFLIAITGLVLGSHYYFGYQRKGTYLLAWTSLFGALIGFASALTRLAHINKGFNKFGFLHPVVNFYYGLEIFAVVIFAYYIYNCWLLYSVNSELRK